MAQAHARRLDSITLTIDGANYECQVTSWTINPPQNVGDLVYTFCPDGSFREEVDPDDWTLDLAWVTDWRAAGLNRILWDAATNDPDTPLDFVLTNHPTITGEAVSWTGQLLPRAPAAGGEARTTERSEMTFTLVDAPTIAYPTV